MRIQVITPNAGVVLVLASVKAFLKVEIATDDAVIQAMCYAAEKQCEKYIRRYLLPTVLGLWFDLGRLSEDLHPDGCIYTPGGKLITVDEIATYNSAGEETVASSSDYLVDSVSEQEGRVRFLTSLDGMREINSLKIKCTVGYATVASVPKNLIHGMCMLVSHWYYNREAYEKGVVPRTIRNLWQSERIMGL